MNQEELQALLEGPLPERQCRDVSWDDLCPGECDEQIQHGLTGADLYCGAPSAAGYIVCRYHLFVAHEGDEDISQLRDGH